VYTVIGEWDVDPRHADLQDAVLTDIVAGVRSIPGFVAGYWAAEPGRRHRHTFVVFDQESVARRFADDVQGNAVNQADAGVTLKRLTIADVIASG
jgi:hypothetical protein